MSLTPGTPLPAHLDYTTSAIPSRQPARPTFLMCRPTLYDVRYVINPWMAGNIDNSSPERAMLQWQQLYDALRPLADMVLVEPQPGSPDMVFTANAGLERNGLVVLSRFLHPERQEEEFHFQRWFLSANYAVREIPLDIPYEGEGDALFAIDGSRLWAASGSRTSNSSHTFLRDAWQIPVVALELIDPRFYHLDTCFAPLSDGSILYFPSAFSKASNVEIEMFYPLARRIVVSESDAASFACNAINIGDTIILNTISSGLRDTLQARHFKVVEVPLSEFLKAGGAAKCLVMHLGPNQPPLTLN